MEVIVDKLAIAGAVEARPGKEKEVEEFLKSAQPLAVPSRAPRPGTR